MLVLLVKLALYQVSLADCLCVMVLLSFMLAEKIVVYNYPKQPNLYTQQKELESKLQDLVLKNEELERDVTAIKFERSMR